MTTSPPRLGESLPPPNPPTPHSPSINPPSHPYQPSQASTTPQSPHSPPNPIAARPLYIIRFTQTHTSFRPAELAAMETLLNAPSLSQQRYGARLKRRQQPLPATTVEGREAGVMRENVKDDHAAGKSGKDKLENLWRQGKRVKVETVRYEEGSPFCVVAFRVMRRRKDGGESGRGHVNRSDGGSRDGGSDADAKEGAGLRLGEASVTGERLPAGAMDDVDGTGATGLMAREAAMGGELKEGTTGNVLEAGAIGCQKQAGATDEALQAGATDGHDGAGATEADREEGAIRSAYEKGTVVSNGEEGARQTADAHREGAPVRHDEIECEDESHDEELLAKIARRFISRSVQAKGIYEIWGHAAANGRGIDGRPTASTDGRLNGLAKESGQEIMTNSSSTSSTKNAVLPPLYDDLHASTRAMSQHRWAFYQTSSSLKFKLSVDSFNHARSSPEQRDIINSFAYLDFAGLVRMKDFNQEWVVFEEWLGPSQLNDQANGNAMVAVDTSIREEKPMYENTYRKLGQLWFTRAISTKTLRPLTDKHDLKKRPYISTTSMDAELALVTANLALAEPGKIFLDPFCGTGGFLVAAAELGAWALGSDIDGRSFRGKGDRGLSGGVGKNVKKYGLQTNMGGCFTGDLVNSPLLSAGDACGKAGGWLDGIIADPPYGVREGLKVLGARKAPDDIEGVERKPHLIDGVPAHTLPGYIAPKKPYSFEKMLDDVLQFAWKSLVDGGRLAFWMPSANENEKGEEEETAIPQHHGLTLLHVCVQRFNRWSRRLLVYERKADELDNAAITELVRSAQETSINGSGRADDLNPFRKRYFQAFAVDSSEGNEPS